MTVSLLLLLLLLLMGLLVCHCNYLFLHTRLSSFLLHFIMYIGSIPFHVPTVVSTTSFDGSCGGRRITSEQHPSAGGGATDIGNVNLGLSSDRLASFPAGRGSVDSVASMTEFVPSPALDRRRQSADIPTSSGVKPNRRGKLLCLKFSFLKEICFFGYH